MLTSLETLKNVSNFQSILSIKFNSIKQCVSFILKFGKGSDAGARTKDGSFDY